MRRRVRVVMGSMVVAVALLASACALVAPVVDVTLEVPNPAGAGNPVYPGAAISCDQTGRCDDYVAEVRRWALQSTPGHGDPASITFHEMVDASGRHISGSRSGGGTWIAVVTFADGDRAAALVGCGVGIDMERCFSKP